MKLVVIFAVLLLLAVPVAAETGEGCKELVVALDKDGGEHAHLMGSLLIQSYNREELEAWKTYLEADGYFDCIIFVPDPEFRSTWVPYLRCTWGENNVWYDPGEQP